MTPDKTYADIIRKALSEKIIERYSAHAAIKAIEKKICRMAVESIMDKYKDEIVICNRLKFRLHGVFVDIHSYADDLNLKKAQLYLHYFCESKLPKDKREKVEHVKSNFKGGGWLGHCNYKIPLWHTLQYEIDCESILSGNIRLSIKINETNN